MTVPSISKNILTVSKVNPAVAQQLSSDRRQNPAEMTCPIWNGMDITGRPVCADSFVTKMEGCNSAEDRIFIENGLRPRYTDFVTLDVAGIAGDGIYDTRDNIMAKDADSSSEYRKAVSSSTGKFGTVSTEQIRSNYGSRGSVKAANAYSDQDKDAAFSQNSRSRQARVIGSSSGVKMVSHDGDYTQRSTGSGRYSTIGGAPRETSRDTSRATSRDTSYTSLGSMPRKK